MHVKKSKLSFLLLTISIFCLAIFNCPMNTSAKSNNTQSNRLNYGAWIGSWPTNQSLIDFQNLQQKHLDIVGIYANWNTNFNGLKSTFDSVYNNKSIVLLTWEANGLSTVDIANGLKDDYIRQMARDIKSYDKDIIIRIFHEGNGNWYSWAIGDSKVNTNKSYIAAFRHVVDLFRREGANKVNWEFNVNASNVGQGSSYLNNYPGDNYVNIISIDGYNWGTTQSWGSTWQSFDEIFSPAYNALKVYNKPISISEISSAEQGGNKSQWITNTFNSIKSSKYSLIKTVIWFNENKETDWRINSSTSALTAYRNAINN